MAVVARLVCDIFEKMLENLCGFEIMQWKCFAWFVVFSFSTNILLP